MQNIFIDKVQIKNCRGLSEMEMEFPLNNFQVIVGKIGTGKSTIFKAISFALFGSDGGLPGETSTLNDLINKKTGKNLEIILDFRVEENDIKDKYQIKCYGNHSKFQNKYFLFKNNVDISGKTKTDTYNYIEKLLVPKNVYFNTVYFGQQIKNFFTSLSNGDQKAIFDSILSLEEFIDYYKKTDESLKEIRQQHESKNNELNYSLLSLKEKDDFLKSLQESKTRAQKEYENQIKTLKEEKVKIENEIECLESEKEGNSFDQKELDSLNQQNAILNSELEKLDSNFEKEKISINDNSNQKFKNEIESLKNSFNDLISKKDKEIFNSKNSINQRNNELNENLQTVIKKYDSSKLEKEKNNFDKEKQKEIQFLLSEINEINKKHSTSEQENEKKNRLSGLNNQLDEIKSKCEPITTEAKLIKKEIERLQNEIDTDEKYLSQEIAICSKCKQPLNSTHISELRKIMDENNSSVKNLNLKFIDLKEQFEQFKKDALELKTFISTEETRYNDIIQDIINKKNEEIGHNERKRNLIHDEIKDFEIQIQNQILSLNRKKEEESLPYIKEIDATKNKSELLERELIEYKKNTEDKFEIDMLNVKSEYNKRIVSEIEKVEKRILEEKKDKESKISFNSITINNLNNSKNKLNSIDLSLQSLKVNLKTLQERLNNQKDFSFDNSEIEKLEKTISELSLKKSSFEVEVSSLKKELDILDFWKQAFSDSGIKSMLIDCAIPHLNECMRDELEFLCPGLFTVSFDTLKMTKAGDLKDKFNVNIRHNVKGTDNHKLLSGGEKRLIDLCCMKSLRSLSERLYNKKFHNYFLDETTDSLDADSCVSFCQMLKMLSKDQNVTIITHSNDYENMEPDRVFKM